MWYCCMDLWIYGFMDILNGQCILRYTYTDTSQQTVLTIRFCSNITISKGLTVKYYQGKNINKSLNHYFMVGEDNQQN